MPEQTFFEAWLLCMLSEVAGTAGAAVDMLDAGVSTDLLTAARGADAEAGAWAAAGAGALGEGWDASAGHGQGHCQLLILCHWLCLRSL